MSDLELNKLTFIIFIFEGLGELLGGLTMVFFSHRIKDTPKAYIAISTLFMISTGIIYVGSQASNKYLIGLGAMIMGFSDCSSMIVALTIAGNWR